MTDTKRQLLSLLTIAVFAFFGAATAGSSDDNKGAETVSIGGDESADPGSNGRATPPETKTIETGSIIPGATKLAALTAKYGEPKAVKKPLDPLGLAKGMSKKIELKNYEWRSPKSLDAKTLQVTTDKEDTIRMIVLTSPGKNYKQAEDDLHELFGTPDTIGRAVESDGGEQSYPHLATWTRDTWGGLVAEEGDKKETFFEMKGKGVGALFLAAPKGKEVVLKELFSTFSAMASPIQKPFLGESFRMGDFAYRVDSVRVRQKVGKNRYMRKKASKGADFVVVRYEIENAGKKTATALAGDLQIKDHKGRSFQPSSEATTAVAAEEDIDLMVSQLQPGIAREQVAVFEIPEDSLQQRFDLIIPEKGLLGSKKTVITLGFADLIMKAMKVE